MYVSISLAAPILDFEGKPLVVQPLPNGLAPAGKTIGQPTNETYGQVIATNVLWQAAKGDALKLSGWARTLYDNKPITIDSADFETLYQLVEKSEVITNYIKGYVLNEMIEAKRSTPV